MLTRSSSWFGKAIRFFSRDKGEDKTVANHVGMIANDAESSEALIIESLRRTVKRKLINGYGDLKDIAIYRANNLSDEDKQVILAKMESYVGRKYGYLKIFLHLGDYVLKRIRRSNRDVFFFRKLSKVDKYPICSYSFAQSWSKAMRYFGVKPNTASPDDIHDFIIKNQDIYSCVFQGENFK